MNVETTRALYTPVIRQEIEDHFPALLEDFAHGELLIHAQVYQESGWQVDAESPCGAKGLLQLMPATDMDIDGVLDGFQPVGNLDNGIRYLGWLYGRFSEIRDPQQRICFALAAYNCGRGYVNLALAMARSVDGLPSSYARWVRAEKPGGRWQRWDFTKTFIGDPRCEINGKRPDFRQVTEYVHNIMHRYQLLVRELDI